jgi:proteasome accessory factor C
MKSDRIEKIRRIFDERKISIVTYAELTEALECKTRNTVYKYINHLRDYHGVEIMYDHAQKGYRVDPDMHNDSQSGPLYTSREIYSLLAMHKILEDLQPGLLDETLQPFKERIEKMLSNKNDRGKNIAKYVRLIQVAARIVEPKYFQIVTTALLQEKRLRIVYHGRSRDEKSEREISPQRLIYYRGNWYLDAFCHGKNNIRSFAVERISNAKISANNAKIIATKKLQDELNSTYGIFSGAAKNIAILAFSEMRARWIEEEKWHSKQEGEWRKDGRYELRVPYSDPRELILDICKYGADVEVLGPQELRDEVAERLKAAAGVYGDEIGAKK